MHSKSGERLYRAIEVKVFHLGNKEHVVKKLRAPSHRGFEKAAIDKTVEEYAERLDEGSQLEYRMVEIAPNRFNFICEGPKARPLEEYANQQSAAEMALGAANA